MVTDDYEWDVFVSYKREPVDRPLITPWIRRILDRMEFWLTQELDGRPVRLFFDQRSIEVGARWPDELKGALRGSRCLLPIWSPEYFRSPWCMAEWKSFVARERVLGGACQLVVPMKFHDGLRFPPEAQAIQTLDLTRLAATMEAFWQTERADELDRTLLGFAPMLAKAIEQAPPFRPDWPVEEPPPIAAPHGLPMTRL